MKKKLIFLVFIFLFFIFTGCNKTQYKVKFYVDNQLVHEDIVSENKSVNEYEAPNKEGYIFDGWYNGDEKFDFSTKVNKNLKLDAKYQINKVQVEFKYKGNVIKTIEVKYDSTIPENEFPSVDTYLEEGYVLNSWSLNGEEFDVTSKIKENITLIATEKIKTFKVTFYDENNEKLKEIEVEYGNDVDESDYPVVEGFVLVNMDKDVTNIKNDISVICEFKQLYKVIIHDINGNPIEELLVPRGSKIENINYQIDTDNRFVYSIKDWYKDKDLTETFKLSRNVVSDMDLYPKVIATPIKETYEGMTVSILGDSISTYYSSTSSINSYYGGTNQFYYPIYSATVKKVEGTWWYKAINTLKAKLGVNNSWSGSSAFGSSNSAAESDSRINTLGENGNPDIVIVFIGTNDNVNGHTNVQFENAMKTIFSKINKKYPNAYILCCTMGYSAYTGYNYTEKDRIAYNEIIRKQSKLNKVKIVEIAEVQTKDNYSTLLGDNLHPNATGMDEISSKVIDAVKEMFSKGIVIN